MEALYLGFGGCIINHKGIVIKFTIAYCWFDGDVASGAWVKVSTMTEERSTGTSGGNRPPGPWFMSQTWHNLLFAHWPVEAEALRSLVPPQLDIDSFEGSAWLGIVVFRLSHIRLHGLPEIPLFSAFPEVNVRTYVSLGGRRGVLFLSLDTDNRLVVAVGRRLFRLAYHPALVSLRARGDGFRFYAERREKGSPEAAFQVSYRAEGGEPVSEPGSLGHWLTERYCYYAASRSGKIYRCDIAHEPWTLRGAQAQIIENDITGPLGIELPGSAPTLHYAHHMKAHIWPVRAQRVPDRTLERASV